MATAKIEGLEPDYNSVSGTPEITRRLSDKVLAAFNHAYAIGETDVAGKLRSVLKVTESRRPHGDKRITYNAIDHADLWIGFVDARNRYRALTEKKSAKRDEVDAALDAMKDAYRAWSEV